MAPASKAVERQALRVRLPLLPLNNKRALGRAAKAPGFQPGEAGSTPAGHSWGSANGRPPAFEAGCEGSNPSPRAREPGHVSGVVDKAIDAEQLLLVVTPGSEPGGRRFDSNFRSSKDGSHPAG